MDNICYAYVGETGEYVCPLEMIPSPEEKGVYLQPRYTTLTPPPEAPEGQVPVWGGDAWTLKPDHRGEFWYTPAGELDLIRAAGDPSTFSPPLSKDPPPPPAPPTPTECSKLGLKRAFGDRWPEVRDFINSDEDRKEEWDLAVTVRKTDRLVQDAIEHFSMTPAEVDALIAAAVLAVA